VRDGRSTRYQLDESRLDSILGEIRSLVLSSAT
jgi:hypothetical protein